MQQLCEMNLGWDDSILEDLEATWHRWVQALPKLEDVTVPRWFMPLENAGSIQLHCFNDACETGYGTVRCATFGLPAVLPGAVNLSLASQE